MMLRPFSIRELLQRGRWPGIALGMTRQQLVRSLGVPCRWQSSDAERQVQRGGRRIAGWALSELLIFGGMEFHFPEDPAGGLERIFCDDLDRLGIPGRAVLIDPWVLREGMTEAQLTSTLHGAGLDFTRSAFSMAPDQIRLTLESGTQLGLTVDASFFDGPPVAGQRLFCIQR